jgi:hypothetical protein
MQVKNYVKHVSLRIFTPYVKIKFHFLIELNVAIKLPSILYVFVLPENGKFGRNTL